MTYNIGRSIYHQVQGRTVHIAKKKSETDTLTIGYILCSCKNSVQSLLFHSELCFRVY